MSELIQKKTLQIWKMHLRFMISKCTSIGCSFQRADHATVVSSAIGHTIIYDNTIINSVTLSSWSNCLHGCLCGSRRDVLSSSGCKPSLTGKNFTCHPCWAVCWQTSGRDQCRTWQGREWASEDCDDDNPCVSGLPWAVSYDPTQPEWLTVL